ncbi:hypothetical protein GIB67_011322 [Kingdonia uniflora]|uniref:CG-1 domain-containing protein n=1 Tax=Kingdonia uniflora TaxID=39325 RepID=A0A7J7MNS2_9MAGN|nr:hypothetical protein GIB67_011322 [Kingdonia uniflora]
MADNRRHASNEPLDLGKILEEAQTRWLRPNEVCEILRNHQLFKLTPDPPRLPSSGSQFLFDRKALRYFRRDGHSWRKKKDGKTVREAHEKLKAGSVDVLHCYYAHGEDNENFQRRSYWMLDSQLEHIVFVHYREVKEGNKLGIPSLLNANTGAQLGGPQSSSSPLAARVDSPGVTLQASYASSPSTANWTGHTPSSEFEDVDSVDELGTSSLAVNVSCSGTHIAHIRTDDMSGFPCSSGNPGTRFGTSSSSHDCSPSIWSGLQSFNGKLGSINKKNCFDQTNSVKLPDTSFMLENRFSRGYSFFPETNFEALYRDPRAINQEHRKTDNLGHANYFTCDTFAKSAADVFQLTRKKDVQVAHPQFQDVTGFCMPTASRDLSLGVGNDEPRGLAKLDSFGRWMNKEIGVDCDDSLMASDSGNYWNTLDTPNDDKEVSSLSRHMQLDIDSLGPSLSKEQLFSICDFSPDWAYSGVDTKVLVTGKFLSDSNNPVSAKWCCMFGEVEVPAEIVNGNVLRCQVPAHSPGRVPFYITCSNRLACSEVREFEYKKNPPGGTLVPIRTEPEEEMCFQIRFANFLSQRADREVSDFSLDNCDKCNRRAEILSMRTDDEKEWGLIGCNHENPKDALIQKLLQDRFYEWLVCKVHEGDKGPHILDVEGQGVIHLAAALGYGWAMAPIVAAGVSPSFRDAHGRTGLHWAAYFGRLDQNLKLYFSCFYSLNP